MITLEIDLNTLIFLLDIDQVLIRLPSHLMAIVRKFNLEKKLYVFYAVSEAQNTEIPIYDIKVNLSQCFIFPIKFYGVTDFIFDKVKKKICLSN